LRPTSLRMSRSPKARETLANWTKAMVTGRPGEGPRALRL
jgi:hypothetical protein